MPNEKLILMVGFGTLVVLVAWLPILVSRLPLSIAILFVAIGAAIGLALPYWPMPLSYPGETETLAEFVVIVALMGAGLKIDRPVSLAGWRVTWRLLGFAMPLTIGIITLIGLAIGLPWPSAILLAALLAPTDPVLAADIQVGPPGSGEEDEARFALTSEAGLNDGLAFPFVNLAIAAAAIGSTASPAAWNVPMLAEWLAVDVLWKIAGGTVIGWLIGRAAGWASFNLPHPARLSRTGDGFLALGLTFISFGAAEWLTTYGFIAVFVTALAFRASERDASFHEDLHDFAEQIERITMMIVLVLFGGALVNGLLAPLTWIDALAGLAVLLLVRPLCGWLALSGGRLPRAETAVIAFFGIRGIGSFYYLAHGLNEAPDLPMSERLWAITAFIVVVSIVLHGASARPVLRHLDQGK